LAVTVTNGEVRTLSQPINIRLLWHNKMQTDNSKQIGNTVSKKKKKASLEKNKINNMRVSK